VEKWQLETKKAARDHGITRTLMGRYRHLPHAKDGDRKRLGHAERASINTPIQGGAADVAMTGMFFEIENNHDEALTLVGGTSDAAERIEIHTVLDGVMQQLEGGLTIQAGETSTLKPGGNHVMLMGLKRPLKVGDEVTVTLDFSNGESLDVTATIKTVNLDQEHYDPDAGHGSMD
jgi:copper(I)-binding protein